MASSDSLDPQDPAYLRVKVGRRLAAGGAVALKTACTCSPVGTLAVRTSRGCAAKSSMAENTIASVLVAWSPKRKGPSDKKASTARQSSIALARISS